MPYLLAQFAKVHTLYATYCAHRHEDRGLDLSVIGGNQSRTGVAGCIGMLYFKLHLFLFFFFGNGEIKRILYNLIGEGKIPYILHVLHIGGMRYSSISSLSPASSPSRKRR